MLRFYLTPQTREMLIAESKRLVAERQKKRREGRPQPERPPSEIGSEQGSDRTQIA